MGTVLFVRADEMCVDEMCDDECRGTFYAMSVICRQDLVVLADITF